MKAIFMQILSSRRGFTLVEISVVFAVFAAVISLIWYQLADNRATMQAQRFAQQIVNLNYQVQLFLADKLNTYTQAELISFGVIPTDMVNGTQIQHILGGTVTVSMDASTYTLTINKISQTGCVRMVSAMMLTPDYIKNINLTSYTYNGVNQNITTATTPLAASIKSCISATDGKTAIMVFSRN